MEAVTYQVQPKVGATGTERDWWPCRWIGGAALAGAGEGRAATGFGLFGCHRNHMGIVGGAVTEVGSTLVDPGPGARRGVHCRCGCKGAGVWKGAILSQGTEDREAGREVSCGQMGGLSCPLDLQALGNLAAGPG